MASKADTPLSLAFFSKMNRARIQDVLARKVSAELKFQIGPQNDDDLYVLMKNVFSRAFVDPYTDVASQVNDLNAQTVKEAFGIMKPKILQDVIFRQNLDKIPPPPDYPGNTSTYGMKIPYNTRIGFQ